jgi:hypothetical protein
MKAGFCRWGLDALNLEFIVRLVSVLSSFVCFRQVGQALGEQYDLYPDNAAAKSMLSKGLGIVLRKATKKGMYGLDWRSCAVSHTTHRLHFGTVGKDVHVS